MINSITGFITGMLTTEGTIIVVLVLFIIFVILVKKLFSLLLHYLWVGIAGAIFPFFASLIGINIALNLENIIFFASSAILLYSVFILARTIYRILSKIEGKAGKDKRVKKLE